ncbi:hypothetical protein GJ496_002958 [Pomphorhynchus laevis]|nr:hypothetical protein GJ496_002958 [Pomphorhynchus laevis]
MGASQITPSCDCLCRKNYQFDQLLQLQKLFSKQNQLHFRLVNCKIDDIQQAITNIYEFENIKWCRHIDAIRFLYDEADLRLRALELKLLNCNEQLKMNDRHVYFYNIGITCRDIEMFKAALHKFCSPITTDSRRQIWDQEMRKVNKIYNRILKIITILRKLVRLEHKHTGKSSVKKEIFENSRDWIRHHKDNSDYYSNLEENIQIHKWLQTSASIQNIITNSPTTESAFHKLQHINQLQSESRLNGDDNLLKTCIINDPSSCSSNITNSRGDSSKRHNRKPSRLSRSNSERVRGLEPAINRRNESSNLMSIKRSRDKFPLTSITNL